MMFGLIGPWVFIARCGSCAVSADEGMERRFREGVAGSVRGIFFGSMFHFLRANRYFCKNINKIRIK